MSGRTDPFWDASKMVDGSFADCDVPRADESGAEVSCKGAFDALSQAASGLAVRSAESTLTGVLSFE